MKKYLTILASAAVFCLLFPAGPATASPLEIPFVFDAGAKAVAAEVNANFKEVRKAVNDNDQRLSHLFGPQAGRLVVSKAPTPGGFQTIQEAINAVPAGAPFVIDVFPGVYVENIIMKSNLHLRGAGRETTVIKAAVPGLPTVTINALVSVAITGIAIINGTPGIQIIASAPTIDQSAVTLNLGHGIHNTEGSGPIITQNALTANKGSGIRNEASSPIVFENIIALNTLNGVHNLNGSDTTMLDNALNQNGQNGIHNVASNPTIGSSLVQKNGANGIRNEGNSNPTIVDCDISKNSQNGMHNSGSSPTASALILTDNGGHGVLNDNQSNAIILDGKIKGNSQSGIRNEQNSNATIGSSLIDRNGAHGIHNLASDPTIVVCVISNNASNGIYNDGNSSPPVVGCKIDSNGNNGIRNKGNSNPAILSCGIVKNQLHGVFNEDSSPQIQGSVIAFNHQDGIHFVGSGTPLPPVVRSNSIASNQGDGIELVNTGLLVVNDNTIALNAAIGVNINGAASVPQVTHNWILANTVTDVVANGGAATNLSFNTYSTCDINNAVGSMNLDAAGLIVPPNSAGIAGTLSATCVP